ncbi:MAG: hypothetical protein LBS70_03975, partial [Candidatus Accumulibacter sp.]|nr:hypothetical protein [Accumulibacter sp.]
AEREAVEIDRRGREIRHAIVIRGEEAPAKPRVYRLKAAACEAFFVDLERERPERWKNDYSEEIMDGAAWMLRIRHTDAPEKSVKGNVRLPPGGQRLREKILRLAPFAPKPRIF